MSMYIGEALVGDGNEIAHIDLLIGSKTGPVGTAFANALANQSNGHSNLLEFYAHSNPLALSLAELPEVVLLAEDRIRVSYQASNLPEIEKRYFVEWSPDLETWEKVNGMTTLDAPLGDGSRIVRTMFSPPAAGRDGGYVRLRAVP